MSLQHYAPMGNCIHLKGTCIQEHLKLQFISIAIVTNNTTFAGLTQGIINKVLHVCMCAMPPRGFVPLSSTTMVLSLRNKPQNEQLLVATSQETTLASLLLYYFICFASSFLRSELMWCEGAREDYLKFVSQRHTSPVLLLFR